MNEVTVIDFFCGAGGFSEGFRQQGFKILKGVDKWGPAVNTFNHNFDLEGTPQDILEFWESIDLINELPNSDVILGSPPCVSFSNSNRSGKADKSLGLRLTEAYLRIVAVKKFQKESKLKAWYMENVTNTLKYLPNAYSFEDLNLGPWAKRNNLRPKNAAIFIDGNSVILNSANYGSAQARKRAIVGEVIQDGKLILPPKTHRIKPKFDSDLLPARSLGSIKNSLPKPNVKLSYRKVQDPIYRDISISLSKLTDHFYDSGLYQCQWRNSKFMKRNHPYMGRMSFPENEDKPSRTVTATNIGTSREAIIYRSEYDRKGDGEYRVPTVREMASLMGFPITYQFLGESEYSKCRLVGNAVCPSVSSALAKTLRGKLGLRELSKPKVILEPNLNGVINLNDFKERSFTNPPKKKSGARFRRHPFKHGNITVTLSNYDVTKNIPSERWLTSVQYGNGEGYPSKNYNEGVLKDLEDIIASFEDGKRFMDIINNGFLEKIADGKTFQKMYESQKENPPYLEPTELIEELARIINQFQFKEPNLDHENIIFDKKKEVPKSQYMALYAISKICSVINK